MAVHTQSGTTTANVVTTVIFASWNPTVEVVNRGSTDLWFRIDKVDPTISGDDCHFVAPMSWQDAVKNGQPPSQPGSGIVSTTEIRLLSTVNCPFTIEVQQ
jgi:hypothetical protein